MSNVLATDLAGKLGGNKRTALDDREEYAIAKKLFGINANISSSDNDFDSDEESGNEQIIIPSASKPVWEDEDDVVNEEVILSKKKSAMFLKRTTDDGSEIQKKDYQERLKSHFIRTRNGGKVPKWATGERNTTTLNEDDSDDEVDAALKIMTRTTGAYVVKSDYLPKSLVETSLLPDISVGHSDGKQITALRFHKSKNVLLTADKGGSIKLFEVDSEAKKEHFLQKIRFHHFPIETMDFCAGDSVICGAMNKQYLMKYNYITGDASQMRMPASIPKQGVGNFSISSDGKLISIASFSNQVYILSATSMEHIQTVSLTSPVVSMTFTAGSSDDLWILCQNGQVNYWQCSSSTLNSFVDDGSIHGTKIVSSNDGVFLACGSNSGIVNIYETSKAKLSAEPKPFATIKSLVTSCDSLAFNHDSQTLAVGSSTKMNQLKLFHMKSSTVFSNFPQHFEKIPHVTAVEFSPHSAYMAVGSKTGRLRLYRMSHFSDY